MTKFSSKENARRFFLFCLGLNAHLVFFNIFFVSTGSVCNLAANQKFFLTETLLWPYFSDFTCLFVSTVSFCYCLTKVFVFTVFPKAVNLHCKFPCRVKHWLKLSWSKKIMKENSLTVISQPTFIWNFEGNQEQWDSNSLHCTCCYSSH